MVSLKSLRTTLVFIHSPPSVRRWCCYVSTHCWWRLHSWTSECFGQRFSVESCPGSDGTLLRLCNFTHIQVTRSPDVDNVLGCSGILHMARLASQTSPLSFLFVVPWNGFYFTIFDLRIRVVFSEKSLTKHVWWKTQYIQELSQKLSSVCCWKSWLKHTKMFSSSPAVQTQTSEGMSDVTNL